MYFFNHMKIRKTRTSDIPEIIRIYDKAIAFMRKSGNLHQWGNGYPAESNILCDIEAGGSYVITDDNENIVATFYFVIGSEPTYTIIKDGQWLDNAPYGVIHRIASDGSVGGILHTVLDFCFKFTDNIRIDTHPDNRVMRNGLLSYGFRYCGIINIANGDERLAYQLHK